MDKHVEHLIGLGHQVKFVRCDNGGEHQVKLQKVSKKYGIEVEYTALFTPQMNSGDRYHMYNPGTKVEFIEYQMTAEQVTKN